MRVRGYLSALPSVISEKEKELSYRVYVTDTLRLHGEGKYITNRWADKLEPRKIQKADDRPPEVIVAEIWARAKIKKKGGEVIESFGVSGENNA